ncbi:hypothetical protein [Fodinibius sp. Rm-B-1B1-1]|uniref:hypothetical protein n=1 Tax=Fodinibius alkaliphilus TaxID=3140241 RepID=UPI00315A2BEC
MSLNVTLKPICQPAYKIGKKVAQKLVKTIVDPEETDDIEMFTMLKVRQSCEEDENEI